jgi:type I restriction enzyme, R subunit
MIVDDVVRHIDTIVRQAAYTAWNESQLGDREVRKQVRAVLNKCSLPITGSLFANAYEHTREN